MNALEQSPKLVQIVLERCSSNEQTRTRVEHPDDLTEHRVDILDSMSLVDNDVLPGDLLEGRFFSKTELVGSDDDVEGLR